MQAPGFASVHSNMYSVPNKLSSSRYHIDGVSKRNQHKAFAKRKTVVDRTDWNRHKSFVGEFSGKRDVSGDCVFTRLQNRSARDLGAIEHFSTHASDRRAAAIRRAIFGRIGAPRLSSSAYERNSSG